MRLSSTKQLAGGTVLEGKAAGTEAPASEGGAPGEEERRRRLPCRGGRCGSTRSKARDLPARGVGPHLPLGE